jgi:hypothetical protein
MAKQVARIKNPDTNAPNRTKFSRRFNPEDLNNSK